MKTAVVLDWPSSDAASGSFLSEWERQVTQELMDAAGFRAEATFVAFPRHVQKWSSLWVYDRIGGQLLNDAARYRDELVAKLQGFDIVLTLGPHAMYCLTGENKIDLYRGTHIDSPSVPGLQVVPTYAPSIYARMAWGERPIVVSAMKKATKRYEDRPRTIYFPETTADLYTFSTQHIKKQIVLDVETNVQGRITDFGISPDSSSCLYISLEKRNHDSVWTAAEELDIFLWLHFLAMRRDLTWIFHNATYDLIYLDAYGIRPLGPITDTMLRHHAYQPEWEKSLGFLASLHVPTRAWKHLRTQAKNQFNKAGSL